jgi:hypothetical protein
MCSAATSAKINLNLKIAAGYCPFFRLHLVVVVLKRVQQQEMTERNDQTMWDSLFDMAVSIADQFEIIPTIPRRPG